MSDISRLEDIVHSLANLYREYAVVLQVEANARVAAIRSARSNQFGVGATDQYVTLATVDATAEVTKLRWDIKALECERDFLMFRIEQGI